jgi:hypothetical protein
MNRKFKKKMKKNKSKIKILIVLQTLKKSVKIKQLSNI